jgi:hypothetical protein
MTGDRSLASSFVTVTHHFPSLFLHLSLFLFVVSVRTLHSTIFHWRSSKGLWCHLTARLYPLFVLLQHWLKIGFNVSYKVHTGYHNIYIFVRTPIAVYLDHSVRPTRSEISGTRADIPPAYKRLPMSSTDSQLWVARRTFGWNFYIYEWVWVSSPQWSSALSWIHSRVCVCNRFYSCV